jgi:hypothetical protein
MRLTDIRNINTTSSDICSYKSLHLTISERLKSGLSLILSFVGMKCNS